MDYWHLKNKDFFQSFKKEIEENYPTLIVYVQENIVHIKGTIRIKDDKDVCLGIFQIDVIVPHNFPEEIPELKETGNRIPVSADRHIEGDGSACLYFRDEAYLYWDEKSTITDYMKKFVENFLLWQIEYEATGGKNKAKAYLHGSDGAFQFYKKILQTDDTLVVYKFIEYMTMKKVKSHWKCFCGSGKEIRNCHFDLFNNYKKKIRLKDARKTFGEINKILQKISEQKRLKNLM